MLVQDTTPPDVTVPADFTVEADQIGGALVTYTATATDLVDGSVTPSCSPASGSFFLIRVNVVSCTATDAAGNSPLRRPSRSRSRTRRRRR